MVDGFSDNGFQRRMPCIEKKVAEITPDDIRVRILGTVIDKKDNRLVVDDGTGKIDIVFDEPVNTELNKFVRIFGRVIPAEGGVELQGEIIQDMSRLDKELLKKVEDVNA